MLNKRPVTIAVCMAVFMMLSAVAAADDARLSRSGNERTGAEIEAAVELPIQLAVSDGGHEPYINGYSDGTFRPDEPLTKAEAVQLVYSLTDGGSGDIEVFPDVPADAWYFHAAGVMAADGVIPSDGTFEPDAEMTRGEFVSMLAYFFPDEGK